jgi:hypothetical protein
MNRRNLAYSSFCIHFSTTTVQRLFMHQTVQWRMQNPLSLQDRCPRLLRGPSTLYCLWSTEVVPTKLTRNATKLGGMRGSASNAATRSYGIQLIYRRNLDKFTLQCARCDKCRNTLKQSDFLCAGNCQRGRHADCHKENPGSKAFKMCTYCEVSLALLSTTSAST